MFLNLKLKLLNSLLESINPKNIPECKLGNIKRNIDSFNDKLCTAIEDRDIATAILLHSYGNRAHFSSVYYDHAIKRIFLTKGSDLNEVTTYIYRNRDMVYRERGMLQLYKYLEFTDYSFTRLVVLENCSLMELCKRSENESSKYTIMIDYLDDCI